MKMKLMATVLAALLLAGACSQEAETPAPSTAPSPVDIVNQVADDYYAHVMTVTPEMAYFAGVELERHDGLTDNSLESTAANDAAIDAMLARLQSIDADELIGDSAWITYAYLLEELEAKVGVRICRTELWNVNQMGGWHSGYAQIAQLQPVGYTGAARAIARSLVEVRVFHRRGTR